jgi:hypothetical protein
MNINLEKFVWELKEKIPSVENLMLYKNLGIVTFFIDKFFVKVFQDGSIEISKYIKEGFRPKLLINTKQISFEDIEEGINVVKNISKKLIQSEEDIMKLLNEIASGELELYKFLFKILGDKNVL